MANNRNKRKKKQSNSKEEKHIVREGIKSKVQTINESELNVEMKSAEETKVKGGDKGNDRPGKQNEYTHYNNLDRRDRLNEFSRSAKCNIPYVRSSEEMDFILSIYDKILTQHKIPAKPVDSLPGPPVAPFVYGEGPVVTLQWEVPFMSAVECPITGYIVEVRKENKWLSMHEGIWESTSMFINIQNYNNCVFRIYAISKIGRSETCLEYTVSYQGNYIQGLPNVGNTCYANSVFQVLAQTPNLMNHLLDIMTRSGINREQSFTGILWKLLMGINKEPSFSDKDEIRCNIQRLINKICTSDGSFQVMEQNDSHSFMMTLFNGIKDEIIAHGCQDGILSIFELFLVTKYEYTPCGHEELAEEQMFTSLLIPIDNYSDGMELYDGIKYLTESEVFADNILPCPFCESPPNSVATKTSEIVNFPEILVLQLGKFREAYGRVEKLDTRVTYDKMFVLQNGNNTCAEKYTLYGLTLHSGSIEGGHYYACVKYQNKEDGTEQWYICNDSFITETNLSYILQDRGVSMLFYHKTEM